MQRLLKRRDFLKAQKGRRWSTGLFSLSAVPREPADEKAPRLGFTVSKANGDAVRRNRIRRRLKEAVRTGEAGLAARAGEDYVIVARPATLAVPFGTLRREVELAFAGVHRPRKPRA
jgi:ribonuclease P protein component